MRNDSSIPGTIHKKILLVEDEYIIAIAESQAITSRGYEVITATTGEEAVEIIKTIPSLDLVLMDIDLGAGIDGIEAAQQIFAIRNIPVVFLTSHSEQVMVEKVRGITRYGYVLKNSGDFVLLSSIEMAFELFDAHEIAEKRNEELTGTNLRLHESQEAQKASQRHLNEVNQMLQLVMDTLPLRIFWKDRDSVYLGCNRLFAEDAGRRAPADLVGETDNNMGWREQADLYRGDDEDVMCSEKPKLGYEEPQTTPDGKQIWLRTSKIPLRDIDSNIIGILGIYEDITERKKAEETLQIALQRFQLILSSLYAGVLVVNKDDQVEFANPAFCELFSLDTKAEEMCRLSAAEIIQKIHNVFADPSDALASIKKTVANGLPVRGEKVAVRGGRTYMLDFIPLLIDGKAYGRLWHHQDITERVLAEETIKSLLTQKDLILKEVHHRIKNNIGTMMSLLLLQSKAQRNPEAGKALKDAMNRLQSMEVLYEKLYRSEDFREISIKDYLPSLMDEIASTFPHKDMVRIEAEMADLVLSTRILSPLGIIMNELITNSMKYAFVGRDDGVIKVSVSLKDNRATLIFEDNGNGIPESIDIEKSTGFGLQLIGLLTKQLKGTIQLERGNGTKFILEFDA